MASSRRTMRVYWRWSHCFLRSSWSTPSSLTSILSSTTPWGSPSATRSMRFKRCMFYHWWRCRMRSCSGRWTSQHLRSWCSISKPTCLFSFIQGDRLEYRTKQGVIGEVFESQNIRVSNNVSEDTDFNSLIDIYTQLSWGGGVFLDDDSGVVPPHAPSIGVLQIINARGIHSLIINSREQTEAAASHKFWNHLIVIFAAAFYRLVWMRDHSLCIFHVI